MSSAGGRAAAPSVNTGPRPRQRAACPVTARGLGQHGPGARPVITGFKAIGSWTAVGNGLYEAELATVQTGRLEMVRFDHRLRPRGRLPKAGKREASWFHIRSHTGNKQITTVDPVPDVTGGEIVQKKYQWIIDRGRIIGVSLKTVPAGVPSGNGQAIRTIDFREDPTLYDNPYDSFDGNGFFVQNHVKCLTELGDWCYDEAAHKFTVFFGSSQPAAHVVEAACVDNLVDLTNRSHVRFNNVAFVGSNGDLVKLDVPEGTSEKCEAITLEGCDLSFAGRNAVAVVPHRHTSFTSDSPRGTVTRCTISAVNNNGISLGENPNWTVTRNIMHHIGMNEGMGQNGDGQHIGVCTPGAESLIRYNDISYIGYTGVYFVGSGTQIRNNHIHHYCLVKADGRATALQVR